MSNQYARLALMTVLCFGWLLPVRAQNDPATRVRNVVERQERDDLATASEVEKTAMRAELRKYVCQQCPDSGTATRELMKLNDAETIAAQVALFNTLPGGTRFSRAAKMLFLASDPTVIPRVADNLFVEESTDELLYGCLFLYPRSVMATRIVTAIGSKAPELPFEVQQSLASLQELPPEERRHVVRQWWNENRSAFASRTYGAVTPAKH